MRFILSLICTLLFRIFSLPLEFPIEFNHVDYCTKCPTNSTVIHPPSSLKSFNSISPIIFDFSENNLFIIPIQLGTPGQNFKVIIDTGSLILWVLKKQYDSLKSNTSQNLNKTFSTTYFSGTASGTYYKDYLGLGNIKIPIEFGVVNTSNFPVADYHGIFGFGRKYSGIITNVTDSHSLIKQLKLNKSIEKESFSIKINENNGAFYVGDYHEDFANKDNIPNCNLKGSGKDLIYWKCRLSHFYIGTDPQNDFKEKSKNVYLDFILDTGSNSNLLPLEYIDFFFNRLDSQNCHIFDQKIIKVIICQTIENIQDDIYVVFNGNAIKLDRNKMLTYNIVLDAYQFNFIFLDADLFLLGVQFFDGMHTLFDGDKKKIMFWSDKSDKIVDVSKYTRENDFVLKDYWVYIIIVIGLLIVIAIIIGLVIYFIKKKKMESEILVEYDIDERIVI